MGVLAMNIYPDFSAAPSHADGCLMALNRH
jgi:hypothetical protein